MGSQQHAVLPPNSPSQTISREPPLLQTIKAALLQERKRLVATLARDIQTLETERQARSLKLSTKPPLESLSIFASNVAAAELDRKRPATASRASGSRKARFSIPPSLDSRATKLSSSSKQIVETSANLLGTKSIAKIKSPPPTTHTAADLSSLAPINHSRLYEPETWSLDLFCKRSPRPWGLHAAEWEAKLRKHSLSAVLPTARKCLTTAYWKTANDEVKLARVLGRLGQLREKNHCSMRQLPRRIDLNRRKTHRDWLLDEMVWLASEINDERNRKRILAAYIAHQILIWHKSSALKKFNLDTKSNFDNKTSRAFSPASNSIAYNALSAISMNSSLTENTYYPSDPPPNVSFCAPSSPVEGGAPLAKPLNCHHSLSRQPLDSIVTDDSVYSKSRLLSAPLFKIFSSSLFFGDQDLSPVTSCLPDIVSESSNSNPSNSSPAASLVRKPSTPEPAVQLGKDTYWLPSEDRDLLHYAQAYSFNWDIVKDILGSLNIPQSFSHRNEWHYYNRYTHITSNSMAESMPTTKKSSSLRAALAKQLDVFDFIKKCSFERRERTMQLKHAANQKSKGPISLVSHATHNQSQIQAGIDPTAPASSPLDLSILKEKRDRDLRLAQENHRYSTFPLATRNYSSGLPIPLHPNMPHRHGLPPTIATSSSLPLNGNSFQISSRSSPSPITATSAGANGPMPPQSGLSHEQMRALMLNRQSGSQYGAQTSSGNVPTSRVDHTTHRPSKLVNLTPQQIQQLQNQQRLLQYQASLVHGDAQSAAALVAIQNAQNAARLNQLSSNTARQLPHFQSSLAHLAGHTPTTSSTLEGAQSIAPSSLPSTGPNSNDTSIQQPQEGKAERTNLTKNLNRPGKEAQNGLRQTTLNFAPKSSPHASKEVAVEPSKNYPSAAKASSSKPSFRPSKRKTKAKRHVSETEDDESNEESSASSFSSDAQIELNDTGESDGHVIISADNENDEPATPILTRSHRRDQSLLNSEGFAAPTSLSTPSRKRQGSDDEHAKDQMSSTSPIDDDAGAMEERVGNTRSSRRARTHSSIPPSHPSEVVTARTAKSSKRDPLEPSPQPGQLIVGSVQMSETVASSSAVLSVATGAIKKGRGRPPKTPVLAEEGSRSSPSSSSQGPKTLVAATTTSPRESAPSNPVKRSASTYPIPEKAHKRRKERE